MDDAAAVINDLPACLRRVPAEKTLRRDARGDVQHAVAEGKIKPEAPRCRREVFEYDLFVAPGRWAYRGGKQPLAGKYRRSGTLTGQRQPQEIWEKSNGS